jgi:predicted ATPase/DNA-binding CsgD family transcriptional regulator
MSNELPTESEPRFLPVQLTSFIGRERELSDAKRLLASARLLTLTGPGGSGKTRLCIQMASEAAPAFPDGVCFVPLAPIRDPELVLSSIAQNLGLQDSRDRPLIEYLISYLQSRNMLLVLDNFEQLLPAATLIAEVLKETRALKLVVTSRACLRISGEQEFPVPPLALPDESHIGSAAAMRNCESVQLFVERARSTLPAFTITDKDAGVIAQIVRRLDGLPLAIELAAARVKLLPPQAMLPRLEHSLGLLVTGARDAPERQRTLRNTIAWSYGLLSTGTQRLLATCSVFRGGASLESIESICNETGTAIGLPVLSGVEELVDHSLLRRTEAAGALRFSMLETIREYANERLAEMPEADRIHESHATAFLRFAEQARRELTGPGEKEWLGRVEREHNNIRAAIDWYRQTRPTVALHLAVQMRPFWSARGHFTEGRQRLSDLLTRVPERTSTRVRALTCAAWLAVDQGDYEDATARLHESIALSHDLGDKAGEAVALAQLGRAMIAGGRPEAGVPYLDQGLPRLRESGERVDLSIALLYWGLAAIFTDKPAEACERLAEGIEMCRQLGFRSLGARARMLDGMARVELGDVSGARATLELGLPTSVELDDHWIIPLHIAVWACLAALTKEPMRALRLAGFAVSYSETHDFSMPLVIRHRLEHWLEPIRQSLAAAAASVAFDAGRHMTLVEAVAYALRAAPEPDPSEPSPGLALTPRELEVAKLVATGLTNRQIAERLYLSVRTVDVHVDHILTKLSFNTRTQVAAWVYETSLLPKNT